MHARDSFETVARLYGEVRRGYPEALFDDLTAMGALGPAARVLEVGCGAGQASLDLARRAGSLLAIDPGETLIAEARARAAADNAAYAVSGFESFAGEPGSFDLVASAQAWHWIAPDVSFAKAADLLAPGGGLAVFGHVPMGVGEATVPAFKAAYDRHAPGAWGRPPAQAWYLPDGPVAALFAASGRFAPVEHRGYAWAWRVDGATLGKYLRTDSGYRWMDEAARFALFDELCAAVDTAGGTDLLWETHLYFARRRD
jgi:SAM-dependent methyltransferase